MNYRALFIADPHMSNKLPYSKPSADGRTDRLDDQLKLWEHVKATVVANAVDAVFILGDLFDKSVVDAVTLTHTVEAVMALGCTVYILSGNHDANSVSGGRYTTEVFGAMESDKVRYIGGKEICKEHVVFWPVPFMPASDTMVAIDGFRSRMEPGDYNVLLMHNSVLGCEHLGWKCDDGLEPDDVCKGFDLVLAGHFHRHQEFGECGIYLGAPMHHSYADVGRDALYWMIDFGTEEVNMTRVDPGLPKFHIRKALDDAIAVAPGDYLRYELAATHPDWIKIKAQADVVCEMLKEQGIHATYKHIPIYHHEARLMEESKEADVLNMESVVSEYVKATAVKIGSLDEARLIKMGRDMLAAARSGHGAV